MCEHCNCGQTADAVPAAGHAHTHSHSHGDGHGHNHEHAHAHARAHDHDHGREHEHGPSSGPRHDAAAGAGAAATRVVDVQRRVLARNDELATRNRAWLAARGVVAINFISSPGTGKTLLLERTLERLRGRVRCAVIAGDQQTDNDARRLAGKGAPVRQIETVSACHLDAERVAAVLPEVVEEGTRLLFIENVGNLVCPAAFDLGENFKVALLSTTEGEDKPVKYPALFAGAKVVVVTKTDLVPHLDWDAAACRRGIQRVHPGIYVFELSARTGEGMDAWIDYLVRLVG